MGDWLAVRLFAVFGCFGGGKAKEITEAQAVYIE